MVPKVALFFVFCALSCSSEQRQVVTDPQTPPGQESETQQPTETIESTERTENTETAAENTGQTTAGVTPLAMKPCVEWTAQQVVQNFDLNRDGRADVHVVSQNGMARCRETDLNFDGQVDMVRFFDQQGQEVGAYMDLDFDGQVDMMETHPQGHSNRTVVAIDTNFDGRWDRWRHQENDRVVEEQQDTDGDGSPDNWEWFDNNGQIIATSRDDDGDGAPDNPPPNAP